jgi:hypothetical protein
VAEQRRFQQVRGTDPLFTATNIWSARCRIGMHRLRDQFLPRARFARDQNRRAARRHLRHQSRMRSIRSLLPMMLGKL